MATIYKYAEVKFNSGKGALLCNTCSVIIAYGFDHKDKHHYCEKCSENLRLAHQDFATKYGEDLIPIIQRLNDK